MRSSCCGLDWPARSRGTAVARCGTERAGHRAIRAPAASTRHRARWTDDRANHASLRDARDARRRDRVSGAIAAPCAGDDDARRRPTRRRDPDDRDQLLAARRRPGRSRSAARRAGERSTSTSRSSAAGSPGLWTAIALTDTDPALRVVVLEAETVGVRGERPERRLLRGEPDPRPGQRDPPLPRRARAPRARGRRRTSRASIAFTREHGIDCDLEETGTLVARRPGRTRSRSSGPGSTRPPSTARTLEFLDRDAVQAEVHSPLWQAGLYRPPGRDVAARPGQARAAGSPGSRASAACAIHEGTPGHRRSSGAPAASRSATADGATVAADHVVVATSAYSGWLRRLSTAVRAGLRLRPRLGAADARRSGAAIGWARPPGPVGREQPVPLLPADRGRPDPVGRLRRDLLLGQPASARSSTGGRRRSRSSRRSSSGAFPQLDGLALPVPLGRRDRHDVAVHGHVRPDDGRPRDLRPRLHGPRASAPAAGPAASSATSSCARTRTCSGCGSSGARRSRSRPSRSGRWRSRRSATSSTGPTATRAAAASCSGRSTRSGSASTPSAATPAVPRPRRTDQLQRDATARSPSHRGCRRPGTDARTIRSRAGDPSRTRWPSCHDHAVPTPRHRPARRAGRRGQSRLASEGLCRRGSDARRRSRRVARTLAGTREGRPSSHPRSANAAEAPSRDLRRARVVGTAGRDSRPAARPARAPSGQAGVATQFGSSRSSVASGSEPWPRTASWKARRSNAEPSRAVSSRAEPLDLALADLVGQRLARPADVAVGLDVRVGLGQAGRRAGSRSTAGAASAARGARCRRRGGRPARPGASSIPNRSPSLRKRPISSASRSLYRPQPST